MSKPKTKTLATRSQAYYILQVKDPATARARHTAYVPPSKIQEAPLLDLLGEVRTIEPDQQRRLALPGADQGGPRSAKLFYAGDASLLRQPCVAVVGSRKVSEDGAKRARKLARELVAHGVVVVSGLAEGVDAAAHTAAIEAGGRTIGVVGTPLDAVYPASHKRLQEIIYREHLLVSQFPLGSKVYPSNFPQRNKIMAAATDATVIVEASDTSGSLHQAAECARLGRWLFIAKSVVDNPSLTWPEKFLKQPKARVLTQTADILEAIGVRS